MRRTASEKMEIIRLVENSDLPVQATLRQIGVPRSTFYGWYQRYEAEGFDGLHGQKPAPRPRWNTIPKAIQDEVLDLALERTNLSPRELACRYIDEERYFISESSVGRILKEADLVTSPAYVLLSASGAFQNPTTRVHEMWQTDFTYIRILNQGWYYLSTVLDDFSRYIIAWKLSPTMGAADVTETLDKALAITGVDQVRVKHRPRRLSDNGSAYASGELKDYLDKRRMTHTRGRSLESPCVPSLPRTYMPKCLEWAFGIPLRHKRAHPCEDLWQESFINDLTRRQQCSPACSDI